MLNAKIDYKGCIKLSSGDVIGIIDIHKLTEDCTEIITVDGLYLLRQNVGHGKNTRDYLFKVSLGVHLPSVGPSLTDVSFDSIAYF